MLFILCLLYLVLDWKLPHIFNSSSGGLGNAKEQFFWEQLEKHGWIMDQDPFREGIKKKLA